MSVARKRPHGQTGDHPESPELKRYLSDGLAALRIAPAGAPSHLEPPPATPFGGAPRVAATSAFLQAAGTETSGTPTTPAPPHNVFALRTLSSRLDDRATEPLLPRPPPPTDPPTGPPGNESRALVLYREPRRARAMPAHRRVPVPAMAVDGGDTWFGGSSARHHHHLPGKRRLLAMVPYRAAKRRLLLGAPPQENDYLPSPPAVVHVGWELSVGGGDGADSALMEIDSSDGRSD